MVDHELRALSDNSGDGHDANTLKQAACLECRRSKIKCVRNPDAIACKKCISTGTECVVPEYHVGRYKGVKNKRSGLEKAIHQVEEAVKKARTNSTGLSIDHTKALQKLLETGKTVATKTNQIDQGRNSQSPETQDGSPDESISTSRNRRFSTMDRSEALPINDDSRNDGEDVVNSADNPLQLLAMASAIPESFGNTASPETIAKTSPDARTVFSNAEDEEIKDFFSPFSSKLDVNPDLDPIELGLVTLSEADLLFKYFHDHLSHTRWGLDETIHNVAFVRSRSSFLFTSIMAASALFLPDTGALSKRLNNHCKTLVQEVYERSYRSLEIVLAFMINIPWQQPGKNWANDEKACYYFSIALTIALDLSLNKIVTPSSTVRPQGVMERVSNSDRIDARRALDLDGHTNIEPTSAVGRRLLRVRERVWLSLFNLDRGIGLARGRPWIVPSGALIDTCDAWHVSDIAVKWDGSLVAAVVLRREFSPLVASIRHLCDNNQQFGSENGSNIVKIMRERVEGFFSNWENTWSYQIRQADGAIPPYVEILVSHGKLSAYCNVINHPTASAEVRQFFRAAGLTSALNVLRVAVQSEQKLRSMPNNTTIMVSFAACFVLGLSITKRNDQTYLAPSAKRSIQEAADALERIGSWPEHRKGASALFGRHIKRIMKQHTPSSEHISAYNPPMNTNPLMSNNVQNGFANAPFTLQSNSDLSQNNFPGFDSLTDDQMLAAIQNASGDIDNFNAGFQAEDGLFMDWLEWPTLS